MSRIGVVGTTGWGTTLAILLARCGHSVTMWARTEPEAERLERTRENPRTGPEARFPDSLHVTSSPAAAMGGADLVLLVVPSTALRENVRRVRDHLAPTGLVVIATKGIEVETGKRMSELVAEEAPDIPRGKIGTLSGPNLAREIATGKRSSATVAFETLEESEAAQAILTSEVFRVYSSDDLLGVELGGALKNIIAIGAGIIDGLGLGDNAKAGFVTRGLREITRLGVALGARPDTFAGLSGMGDMVATCYSGLSRNRFVGQELATGRKLADILLDMNEVAEGVTTTAAAVALAKTCGVEMPITEMTRRVLFDSLAPKQAMEELMRRAPVPEVRPGSG